ncbi:MAG: acetyl-CoA carboxylase biotin carboxylase subunit [Deltaproteobacteria bacterium]|nr:MAG: acetyl-CoA carboxylase biotin carboxylase subunit [Deltaproteobacteria bacterium]
MNLRPFHRVLVANRGEIAVRIIRGCHEHGLEAVAIASDADLHALPARLANEVVPIGPAPSSQSYLLADRVLRAALDTGCDAVHPGYGFLAENADFAQAVLDAGLVWIGPPPSAIRAMGSKTAARQTMSKAGVPVVPGTVEALADPDEAMKIAHEIGFPIMLKAAAGGGGKGMRRVDRPEDLHHALSAAQSEGEKSFGDGAVYVEKLIERGRHVEIQVLADGAGQVVHLFERDCSIQRRHQKVFEEAPSPVLEPETRRAMGEVACEAARAVGYIGAGTCEFLLAQDGSFYFLEMNTRLQVEHPITEMITGVDLVGAQLRVAAGEPLGLRQEELTFRGHAVECRIYAEDPYKNFMPSPGPLKVYREPSGPWVRVDSGVVEGADVPIHYDPMVAKLVVWGEDRAQALARAARALRTYKIVGIPTSIPFFLALFQDPSFIEGRYNTGFLTPEWLDENLIRSPEQEKLATIAAAIASYHEQAKSRPPRREGPSPWVQAGRITAMRGR